VYAIPDSGTWNGFYIYSVGWNFMFKILAFYSGIIWGIMLYINCYLFTGIVWLIEMRGSIHREAGSIVWGVPPCNHHAGLIGMASAYQ